MPAWSDGAIEGQDGHYLARSDLDAELDTSRQLPIRPDVGRLRGATRSLLFGTEHGRLDVRKEAGPETYEALRQDAAERSRALGILPRKLGPLRGAHHGAQLALPSRR